MLWEISGIAITVILSAVRFCINKCGKRKRWVEILNKRVKSLVIKVWIEGYMGFGIKNVLLIMKNIKNLTKFPLAIVHVVIIVILMPVLSFVYFKFAKQSS